MRSVPLTLTDAPAPNDLRAALDRIHALERRVQVLEAERTRCLELLGPKRAWPGRGLAECVREAVLELEGRL